MQEEIDALRKEVGDLRKTIDETIQKWVDKTNKIQDELLQEKNENVRLRKELHKYGALED